MRPDGRKNNELRTVAVTRNFIGTAEGSVLIEVGNTRVICTASIEEKVPPFLKDQNRGWVTAEYSMIPRATQTRMVRESAVGRVGGRTHEIQRLIGRSLRAVVDMAVMGQRTLWVDCDVIQADGGTRTAAISGAFICVSDALDHAVNKGIMSRNPLRDYLAAISVGIVNGEPVLDLCYREDSSADVDMNIVMTGSGDLVEIQGTAEGSPFSQDTLDAMLKLSREGIAKLVSLQRDLVPGIPRPVIV